MRVSSLAAATSISAVAVVIVGIALAQDSAMGQRSAPGASTALTISSAASESEFGEATVILSEKMERNAESNEIKPTPVAEEKIKSALAERADFEFTDTPLQQAIAEIADMHQINVIIDTLALDEVGLEPDAAVTLGLSDTSLESSLHFMLRPLALTWTVYKGVLVITTPEEAEEMLITKVYDVGDLVRFQDKEGKEWSDYDTLIELVTSAIQPDTWDVVGGAGAIEAAPFGNAAMLTVAHTYQAHGEIDDLLDSFREITEKTNVQGLPFREQPTGGIMGGMGDDMGIVRRSTMQKES